MRKAQTKPMPEAAPAVPTQRQGRVALACIIILASIANGWGLWQHGHTDPYFATAVQSMLTSWHNFFFVAFDPAGFISVDKPPLGLWLQAALARLLGFSDLSLVLPQALAGVLSVALLYHLVQRPYGEIAGLGAALALAITPICVATNRSNATDSLVMLSALAGAWGVRVAAERGKLRPLLLCALALGLGFNVKVLQALLVAPAFALAYLLAVALPWRTRCLHLALATVVLLVVSLSWVVVVDHMPASSRPFVGSSSNNTALDLVLGYYGFGRFTSGSALAASYSPQIGSRAGDPGPFRLLNEQLGGQVSFLLPVAVLGLLVGSMQVLRARRHEQPSGRRRVTSRQPHARLLAEPQPQALLLWGTWLLSLGMVLSVANYFHPYNLVMLAPPICALSGIALSVLWREFQQPHGQWWWLPLALSLTTVVQAVILLASPSWNPWIISIICVLGVGASAWLTWAHRAVPRSRWRAVRWVAALGALTLLIAPAGWASVPLWHYANVEFPLAGPALLDPSIDSLDSTLAFLAPPTLTHFLQAQHRGERFIMAAPVGGVAGPVMLATKQAVMTYGGYLGLDPILTPSDIANFVRSHAVRFFWQLPQQQSGDIQPEIGSWVTHHCTIVAQRLWQPQQGYGANGPNLYDCAPFAPQG